MNIGRIHVDSRLVLAPMAGVTDLAFRQICRELGAGLTVTEMVSAKALCYQDRKTRSLLRLGPGEHPAGVQIFGSDAACMAEAACMAAELSGADFIDINMGCPVGKVVSNGDGSALMKDPEKAARIAEAVVKACPVPVTVKMRRGWDKGSINVLDFTRRMEDSGAAMVAVHGRTRSMLYSGTADWDAIHKVKEQLTIPVIANGDITGGEAAVRCLKRTGADGLMIGRSVFGDPWIFQEVNAALAGKVYAGRPCLKDRVAVAVRQFQLAEEDHGEHIACLEARKHFAWYLKGVPHSGYYKNQISSLTTMEDIYRVAKDVVRDLT